MSRRLTAGVLTALLLVAGAASAEPPGQISFVARNLFATANGTFHEWRITRSEIDPAQPQQSFVEVEIDVASLDTGIGRRDDHLRSDDFFDVEQFPTATVRAHSIREAGERDGRPLYRVALDLDLHGHRKTVEAEVVLLERKPPRVRGEVVLDRNDFAIGSPYRRLNPLSIRDSVPVKFEARLPQGTEPTDTDPVDR